MEEVAYEQMRKALARWVEWPDDAWLLMKRTFRVARFSRLEFVSKPGDTSPPVVFVCSGLLRYFSGSRTDKPVNKAFLSENMLMGPFPGCPLSTEGDCGIQALEPTVALIADASEFDALYDRHPIFDRLGRKLSTWRLEQNRTLIFQKQNAEERYRSFVRQNPNLAQRLSQVHIASYLGITEVSLSRIRRQLARPRR